MAEKEAARVHISDKQGSVKYIESSVEEDEGTSRVRRHSSEEFERLESSSEDCWSKRYYYLLFSILIGSGNDMLPLTMKLTYLLSGGGIILLMLIFSLTMGLPLVYMEAFLGRYTKLTNCQMYRMVPIFFGICFVVYVMNVLYQPLHVMTETQTLVNLLKLLANPNINSKCPDKNSGCYDYVKRGPLNDNCTYGHISMLCEKHGEIRYLMEYQYWNMYKDPSSPKFPYYQIITAVVITWILILVIVMKKIQVLEMIVHLAFIIQIITLTLLFVLALTKNGGAAGLNALIKVDLSEFKFHEVLLVLWHSISRLGLIIPTGYMTFSAYTRFKSNIGTECFIVVACSVALSCYYLAIFFSICGALAHTMGVSVEAVFVPDRGLYLAIVPQFLIQLEMPNIFLIIYYGSVWFFESVKIAFYCHMLILNLYDYFPNLKNFATYIWVTSCLIFCFLSATLCDQYTSIVFAPIVWTMYTSIIFGVCVTIEATMVSYFYGVKRLCEDIYFMTGQKPMQFWRIMWYVIPLIGWVSLVSVSSRKMLYFEVELALERSNSTATEDGLLYATLMNWGYLALAIISTIMYISFRFGTPDLLLTLLKPQYFWGPSERKVRIDRKNFCPHSNIRSQQIFSRVKQDEEEFEGVSRDGALISQFSKDVLVEQTERGDVMNDKTFFEKIGILSQAETYSVRKNSFSKVKERELDVQEKEDTTHL